MDVEEGQLYRMTQGVLRRVKPEDVAPAAPPAKAEGQGAGAGAETGDLSSKALPGVCDGLATLPRHAHLDARALATILGRTVRTIDRATARSELPAPVRLLGRRTWLVGTILDHFEARQAAALEASARHERKILEHSA